MSDITIHQFDMGEAVKENLAQFGYLRYARGVDLWGVGAGTAASCPHTAGIVMPSQEMVAETEGAVSAGTHISAMCEWIEPYKTKTFALTNNNKLIVSESLPSADTQQQWYVVSAISSTTGGGGLKAYGSNLYYAQNGVLGKTDGTATNNNFQTFTDTGATPRPMKIFAGYLCIGDGRYLAVLDTDETTFNATRLTLPTGFVIRSLAVWNKMLAILADFIPSGASYPTAVRLYLWNGADATVTDEQEIPLTSVKLGVAHDNLLYIFGDDGGVNGKILTFNGAQIEEVTSLPKIVFHGIGSFAKFENNILVGTDGRTPGDNGGIYMVNRNGVALSHLKSDANAVSAVNVAGLYAEGNNILAGWYDGDNYGIDRADNDQFPDSGALVQTLPLHFGYPELEKTFLSIKPDVEALGTTTGSTLQILYRIKASDSFTALKTIYASDSNLCPTIPIRGAHGKRIEFQFKWVTTSNAPLRLRSYTVRFSPQGLNK